MSAATPLLCCICGCPIAGPDRTCPECRTADLPSCGRLSPGAERAIAAIVAVFIGLAAIGYASAFCGWRP